MTGHSHGALMTANLVAHSDLFRAGVATSGSYNKTLTPFGFQNERRSVWEAPDVYLKVSPFFFADKIKTPLLIMHGEDDANPGTTPLQATKLYEAIRGNGGTARLVMLPHEPHWYAAMESNEQLDLRDAPLVRQVREGRAAAGEGRLPRRCHPEAAQRLKDPTVRVGSFASLRMTMEGWSTRHLPTGPLLPNSPGLRSPHAPLARLLVERSPPAS